MVSARKTPLIAVAATDLALVAVIGSPWVLNWSTPGLYDMDGVLRYAVGSMTFPGWGAGDDWPLASTMDHLRAGVAARITVFLLAHLWVVDRFVAWAASDGRWRAARTGAWALGPPVGALAGLSTVAPAAFDLSITADRRDVLREVAIVSLVDGAYWGLFAGATCGVVMTVALAFSEEDEEAEVFGIEPDEPFTLRQVRAMLARAVRVAAPAFVVSGVLVLVLGGPLLAGDGQGPSPALARVLRYVHYVDRDAAGAGVVTLYSYPPIAAVPLYFYFLAVFLLLGAPGIGPEGLLRGIGGAWQAVTWALLAYAGCVACLQTLLAVIVSPGSYGGRLGPIVMALGRNLVTELPNAAAYTALLGWIPALAMVAAARVCGPVTHSPEPGKRGRAP